MEMSNFDPIIPRFYKGYDLNELADRRETEGLSEEEEYILVEADEYYYDKLYHEKRKKWVKDLVESIRNGENPHIEVQAEPILNPDNTSIADAAVRARKTVYKRTHNLYEEMCRTGEIEAITYENI